MPPHARLGLDIKRAEQALMTAKSSAVRAADLTVAQYPGISAAGLARACLVTPQAMAAVLKIQQERGLVERSAHPWHNKVLEISLTEAGHRALSAADMKAVRIERRLADEFTAEEQETLRALLDRCVQAGRQDQ
jgi:DNA-binding MarR family transcriptional regulator